MRRLSYRLRWLSQGSISKVPQSMVDASLELYPIPYFTLFVRAAPLGCRKEEGFLSISFLVNQIKAVAKNKGANLWAARKANKAIARSRPTQLTGTTCPSCICFLSTWIPVRKLPSPWIPSPTRCWSYSAVRNPKRKPGAWEAMQNLNKGICFPSLSSEVTIVSSLGYFPKV